MDAVGSSWANSYSLPYINTTYKNTVADITYGNGSGKYGVYYTYCAVSAGSYCYGGGSGNDNAYQDICPVGWRLPTGGSYSGEFFNLKNAYNDVDDLHNAFSVLLSGVFWSGNQDGTGVYGRWIYSTYNNVEFMQSLYVTTNAFASNSINPRSQGNTVCCLLR